MDFYLFLFIYLYHRQFTKLEAILMTLNSNKNKFLISYRFTDTWESVVKHVGKPKNRISQTKGEK
jgi:hypothetical protein